MVVGPSDDKSESVCVCLGASPRAPRFLVCYRAPKAAAAPLFRVIQHHADECGAIGAPLVIGGDLNLPTLQLAQSGVDRRALSGERETADETAFRALLAATRLTVKSGTIAACGPAPHNAITRVQTSGDDVQFSELDFIVANEAAGVTRCVTENSGPRAVLHDDEAWARSDHCPLWCIARVVLEDADIDLSSLGWHPATPRADWASATAEQRAQLPVRIKDDQSELSSGIEWCAFGGIRPVP